MKIAIQLEYRGQETKKTQKGKDYIIIYFEDTETGEPLKFMCFDKEKFNNFSKLEKGNDYTIIFEVWNSTLFLDGVA